MKGRCVRVVAPRLPPAGHVHRWISVGMCAKPLIFTALINDPEVKLIVR